MRTRFLPHTFNLEDQSDYRDAVIVVLHFWSQLDPIERVIQLESFTNMAKRMGIPQGARP